MYLKSHWEIATLKPAIEYEIFPIFEFSFGRFSIEIYVFKRPKVSFWRTRSKTSIHNIACKSKVIFFSHNRDSLIPYLVSYWSFWWLYINCNSIFLLLYCSFLFTYFWIFNLNFRFDLLKWRCFWFTTSILCF